MQDAVLSLNAGSSSFKFAVHCAAEPEKMLVRGKVTGIGRNPEFSISLPKDIHEPMPNVPKDATHENAADIFFDWLASHSSEMNIVAVGHRVVHGGRGFSEPVRITPDVLKKLTDLIPLAPLHQPHNLAAITRIGDLFPDMPQIACFDTAFHCTQDPLAKLYAIPYELSEEGLIRYGFHGLSYEYIASILPEHLGDKAEGHVIVAHLGNGASLCGMNSRKSVTTTMGFTALDGLMMGRRSGEIDPGLVLHLAEERGMSIPEIHELLYQKSGLLGVSGISNSMRDLEASDHPRAKLAIELFAYRAAAEIASLIPALGGLDAVVFTAGIGENSASAREAICDRLGWIGIDVDPVANRKAQKHIEAKSSRCPVLVLPTNEDEVIAKHTLRLADQ